MLTRYCQYVSHSLLKFPKVSMFWGLKNLHNTKKTVTLKKIYRNFQVCRKTEQIARQNYCGRMVFFDFIVKTLINSGHVGGRSASCNVCYRFYSSMKDDEIVKSWLGEIKDDFDRGYKTAVKVKDENSGKTSSNADKNSSESTSETDAEILHTALENDLDKLEKLGFTTEEIIDLMKDAKSLEETEGEYDHSESENADDMELSKESNEALNSDDKLGNTEKQNGQSKVSTNKMKQEEWAVVKLKSDVKTDWSVVEIEDFVNIAEAEADVEETWGPPVDLVRGRTGVYDIQELIEVLRDANAQNVITIRVPPNLNFADYLVIASAKSLRHMQAVTSDVKWIYKRKKSKTDKYLRIEGEKSEWYAMDLECEAAILPCQHHLCTTAHGCWHHPSRQA
ncbi:uncharacterized protein LOC123538571 isoform X2 [Mercenaria mercenaria]|uniref:uncharacterized protein LOC123538571 isoform X2 n=1 Tax=Mercenaria mercenaria TaxID=6596 RepID=UPI00234EE85A|nr:uncharacterized protein LOC123538571 isoform X2 [Mercenaria mercenaria]